MKKNKKKKLISKREKKLRIVNCIVMSIIFSSLWAICIANLYTGNLFGYRNYYNQPVGTDLSLAQ